MADAFGDVIQDLIRLSDKFSQVNALYEALWNERTKIYLAIFVEFKKHPPFVDNLGQSVAQQVKRLTTINQREFKILSALEDNKEATFQLVSRVRVSLNEMRQYAQIHPSSGQQTLAYARETGIERMVSLVNLYFIELIARQKEYLAVEREFIARPTIDSLGRAYCGIIKLGAVFQEKMNAVQSDLAEYQKAFNLARITGEFLANVQRCIGRAGNVKSPGGIKRKLSKIMGIIKPYFDANNARLYGNWVQRAALNITQFHKIQFSLLIRMGLVYPIISKLVSMSGLDTDTSASIYLMKINIHTWVAGYLAYLFEIQLGLSKYPIEGLTKLLSMMRNATGSENPLNFQCT